MHFAIQKRNNDYNFFASHNKAVLIAGTAVTKEQALKIIFDIIRANYKLVPCQV